MTWVEHMKTIGNRTPGIRIAVRSLEHAFTNIGDGVVTSILAWLLGVRLSPYKILVAPAKRPIHGTHYWGMENCGPMSHSPLNQI